MMFLTDHDLMLKKQDAKITRHHALNAIQELAALFHFSTDKCSPEQHDEMRRGVGLAMGKIKVCYCQIKRSFRPQRKGWQRESKLCWQRILSWFMFAIPTGRRRCTVRHGRVT